jgi:hypothetical protein
LSPVAKKKQLRIKLNLQMRVGLNRKRLTEFLSEPFMRIKGKNQNGVNGKRFQGVIINLLIMMVNTRANI